MGLTVATICKNEADRWLESALQAWTQFADRIVAVDDGSTDETGDLLRDYGCEVHEADVTLCGNSSTGRQLLWSKATPGSEWVLVLDADMVPASDPRPHMEGANFLSFRYFDLWNENEYRADAWWTAHSRPRIWACRPNGVNVNWEWPTRATHSSHFPANIHDIGGRLAVAPLDASLLHYGYATPEARQRQYEKYKGVWDDLRKQERFHVETIMDEDPNLVPLPFDPQWRLRVRGSAA